MPLRPSEAFALCPGAQPKPRDNRLKPTRDVADPGPVGIRRRTRPDRCSVRHTICSSLVCAAAVAGLLAAPGVAVSAPTLDGLNLDAHWLPEWNPSIDAPGELNLASESQASWVRMSISWNALESSGASAYRQAGSQEARALAQVERAVDNARADGLNVLLFVDSTPGWANGQGAYAHGLPPAESHYSDYAAFVGRMAERFQGRVGAWQIWNEPNLSEFWSSPDAAAYGRLVAATAPQIRAAEPGAMVVSAGLSPDGADPYAFLEEAMASGMAGSIDRLGLHAYPETTPERCNRQPDGRPVRKELCALGQLVADARNHQPGVSAWVTEIGWSNYDRPGWGNHASETDQASYLERAEVVLSATEGLERAFWYGLHDLGADPHAWVENLGLTRSDYSPKPSFAAFAAMNGGGGAHNPSDSSEAQQPAATPTGSTSGAQGASPQPLSAPEGSTTGASTCFGQQPTIIGTPGPDVITGTNGSDVILTLGGRDVVFGLQGNDRICLGSGNDRAIGGAGRDRIAGEAGDDRLTAGAGNDRVIGGPGRDRMTGGGGDDRLVAGAGRDRVSGGGGNDRMFGGPGADLILGQRGRDQLVGGAGADRLIGASGHDVARGGRGDDHCAAELMTSCRRSAASTP